MNPGKLGEETVIIKMMPLIGVPKGSRSAID
jgi:hypothetical protein